MRMMLHKSTWNGEIEVYQIYELDFDRLSTMTGYTETAHNDNVGSKANKYREWNVINNQAGRGIATNIPKSEVEKGCILPFWHRFTNQIGNRYYLDADVLSSFSAIGQGIQPADWGSNPNYVAMYNGNYDYHNIQTPYPVPIDASFSASTSYYEDTKRTQLRMFYTESGNSFSVSKTTYFDSYGRLYMVAQFPDRSSITPHYSWTDENGQGYDRNYKIRQRYCITGNDSNSWQNMNVGYNMPHVFVHYVENGVDFYGVALIQFDTFDTETNTPIAIAVSALDSAWWGASIIPGGESGAGTWGNNTVPTVNDGTFSSTSNSVKPDNANYSTTAIQTRVNTALTGLFSGLTGVYSIYLLDTASGQSISFTELTRIYNVLYASGNDKFLTRYLQSMYNPLSAVIAMHLIPYQFTASALFGATVKKQLTISGYNVSTAISATTPPEYNILKPLGRVVFPRLDMPKYFGGFADFAPYTQCILHLPFIGAIELKTNAIAHGSITVEYLCDMISGNVTARISCTDNTGENTQYVHTASGNCAYNLPLFTMNQNGDAVGKLLSGGAGIVSGALTGNPVNVATGIAGVVGSAIESSFSPRSTQISGNMGGNNMLMSNLDIWLEIVRPVWVENMYYQKLNGIPADMSNCIADSGQSVNLGFAYDGFLQIEKIDLDNVPCTEQEKQEIETLLKQGVFIRGDEI